MRLILVHRRNVQLRKSLSPAGIDFEIHSLGTLESLVSTKGGIAKSVGTYFFVGDFVRDFFSFMFQGAL